MSRTDQPVLVQREQLETAPVSGSQSENTRAQQRNIMEMQNIKRLRLEEGPEWACLQTRLARLMGQKRREPPATGSKSVNLHRGVTCIGNRRRSGMEQVVGIQTVHHIDVVTCIRQRMSQAVDENSIPAETVGRVKGRQMQEVKWSQPGRNTNVSRLSVPGSMLRGFAGW